MPASTITLKRRIKSVSNTRQITKAMQLVSASKLRKAQSYAASSREYQAIAYSLLQKLSYIEEVGEHPLFKKRNVRTRLFILITSNTGLAGAYNSNALKALVGALKADDSAKIKNEVITVGSKGSAFVRKLKDADLVGAYPPFPDNPTANDIRPILNTVVKRYENEEVDSIKIVYTVFKSNLVQEATILDLLPALLPEKLDNPVEANNFEPDVETAIEQIGIRLIETQIWQAVLESLASEHAMRMIATKNATDNANDLIDDYTLELNTARQAAITQELAEITGGAEAMAS